MTQLDIEKPSGRIMMSVIMLVRSINYGRSIHRQTQEEVF